ncbi:uncharacterized protein LOC130934048 [Arachis stenosperma]|uniref:uncharacterized protein LOC130934048 n=1 Tax=Arachis stenosperma TaxID=217475 RepID=UPI0025ABA5AC|nr:uncharacterized protein LOC130934048 [Arachis stenosperma]
MGDGRQQNEIQRDDVRLSDSGGEDMAADLCPLCDVYHALLIDSGRYARSDQVYYGGSPAVFPSPDQEDDELPPPIYGKEKVIPWGTWVDERPAPHKSRARSAAVAVSRPPPSSTAAASGPSSSIAATGPSVLSASASQPPPPPSSTPHPTYRLVQHLIRRSDWSDHRIERHFRRMTQMLASLGAIIPPDSDTSEHSEEEADHQEEAGQAEVPLETQASPLPRPQPQP